METSTLFSVHLLQEVEFREGDMFFLFAWNGMDYLWKEGVKGEKERKNWGISILGMLQLFTQN